MEQQRSISPFSDLQVQVPGGGHNAGPPDSPNTPGPARRTSMTPPRASQAFPRQRLGSERDSVTFSEDLNLALLGDNTDDKVAMTVPATGA